MIAPGLVDAEAAALSSVQPKLRTRKPFLEDYVESYIGSERTKKNYKQTKDWLLKHFDGSGSLAEITAEDMTQWAAS